MKGSTDWKWIPQLSAAYRAIVARYVACCAVFQDCRLLAEPLGEPEGLWLTHIHHKGELENSSKTFAPRARALSSIALWFASAFQFQLEEVGALLNQFSQKPCIWRWGGMLGETCMDCPWMGWEVQAPAL